MKTALALAASVLMLSGLSFQAQAQDGQPSSPAVQADKEKIAQDNKKIEDATKEIKKEKEVRKEAKAEKRAARKQLRKDRHEAHKEMKSESKSETK